MIVRKLVVDKSKLLDENTLKEAPEAKLLENGNIHLVEGITVEFLDDDFKVSVLPSSVTFSKDIGEMMMLCNRVTNAWMQRGFFEVYKVLEQKVDVPAWVKALPTAEEAAKLKAEAEFNQYKEIVDLLKAALQVDSVEEVRERLLSIISTQQKLMHTPYISISSPEELSSFLHMISDMTDDDDKEDDK